MTCCAGTMSTGPALFDPETRKKIEEERVRSMSSCLEGGLMLTRFIVPDMHCIACIRKIEDALIATPNVRYARANLSLREVTVRWDSNTGSGNDVIAALVKTGFSFHFADQDKDTSSENEGEKGLLLALAVAGFAAANVMLLSVSVWSGASAETAQLFHLLSGLIAVPAVAIAGRPFFASALRSLSVGRLNMDVPISLAVVLALVMSMVASLQGDGEAYFDASVTLLFFLLIGRYLDQLMRNRARGASERLVSMSAKGGLKVGSDGELQHLDLHEIKPGMVLRILPGERLPVDGEVLSGQSSVDCSHVTGESEPQFANPGFKLQAGALNLASPLDILTVSNAEKSFLGEMQRMMREAENGRSQYVRIADRMAQIYAPAVHLLALFTFIGWMIFTGGDWYTSIYTAIAVLIITCPCALGLAVPVAHVIGAKRLMEEGILMRDGTALERIADVDIAVFDKTGTLTDGISAAVLGEFPPSKFGSIIRTLSKNSSHPVSEAVAALFEDHVAAQLEQVREYPGLGVEAIWEGRRVRLGKPEWAVEIAEQSFQASLNANVVFAVEHGPLVCFETTEQLREDAYEAITSLKSSGLDVSVVSGDRAKRVESLAKTIGAADYQAQRSPADKIAFVEKLKSTGAKVLMVGDGINDAPALAAGTVSMAPADASDAGRMASDFIFTRPSLIAVPTALAIANTTGKIVRQNFALAIAYNCVAVPLAMAGYVTPLFAAIAMSASSIAVVGNSLRINLACRNQVEKSDGSTNPIHVERVVA